MSPVGTVSGLVLAAGICWWFWAGMRAARALNEQSRPRLEPRYRGPEDDPAFMAYLRGVT